MFVHNEFDPADLIQGASVVLHRTALLHDRVEDQGGKAPLEDVRSRFGERAAKVVDACLDERQL